MTPPQALQILVSLMSRLSLSPAEMAGAQYAVDTLKAVVEPVPPPEAPPPQPVGESPPFIESVTVKEGPAQ